MTDWNALHGQYNSIDACTDWLLGYSTVENRLGDVGGKRILDFGCGNGKFSKRLTNLGAKVHAIDTSFLATQIAAYSRSAESYDVLEYVNNNIQDEPRRVDTAVANFVFCTMQSDTIAKEALNYINESLPRNGQFVLLDPHPEGNDIQYRTHLRRQAGRDGRKKKPEHPHINVWLTGMKDPFIDYWRSDQEYQSLLDQAGFNVVSVHEPVYQGDNPYWEAEGTKPPHIIYDCRKKK